MYSGVGSRQQIAEEMLRYADKELRFRYPEAVLQNYLNYILLVLLHAEDTKVPVMVSSEENKEKEKVLFPTDAFKLLVEFTKGHICLRTLLDIIIELLRAQGICDRFCAIPEVYFNEGLIIDIYRMLASIFKDVLKKVSRAREFYHGGRSSRTCGRQETSAVRTTTCGRSPYLFRGETDDVAWAGTIQDRGAKRE